jgi:hypothetical protein
MQICVHCTSKGTCEFLDTGHGLEEADGQRFASSHKLRLCATVAPFTRAEDGRFLGSCYRTKRSSPRSL